MAAVLTITRSEIRAIIAELESPAYTSDTAREIALNAAAFFAEEPVAASLNYTRDAIRDGLLARGMRGSHAEGYTSEAFAALVTAKGNAIARRIAAERGETKSAAA